MKRLAGLPLAGRLALPAMIAAPFLPGPAGPATLLALFAVWAAGRPPRRELGALGAAAVFAAAALGAAWVSELREARPLVEHREAIRARYEGLWQELEGTADRAVRRLGTPPFQSGGRLAAFRILAELAAADPGRHLTLLILDPDGEAVAWAGEGLLHEPPAAGLPASGSTFQASYTAATFLAVRSLSTGARPWRLVAGRSLPTDRLPFGAPGEGSAREARWTLVPAGKEGEGAVTVSSRGRPSLVVAPGGASGHQEVGISPPRRGAWLAIGLGLVCLALMRGMGAALRAGAAIRRRRAGEAVLLPALAGGPALAVGLGAPAAAATALGAGLAAAATGVSWGRRAAGRNSRWAPLVAGIAGPVLAGSALAYQVAAPGGEISDGPVPELWALRLAAFALALGLLVPWAGIGGRDPRRGDGWGWAWAAAGLLLAAAAVHDFWWPAVALLALGTGCTGAWQRRTDLRRPGPAAAICLLAALTGAAGWEAAQREAFRTRLAREALPRMAPPSSEEIRGLAGELEVALARPELEALVPRGPGGLERQDLAFALWRASPLARGGRLSALVVSPRQGPAASFSLGLPMADGSGVDWSPARWEEIRLPMWEEALVAGQGELSFGGELWGTLRYWMLPRPGFRIAAHRIEELAAGLLRGGPTALRPSGGLFEPAVYALYAPDGRALLSPWRESPPLPPALRVEGQGLVATPAGAARAFSRRAEDGFEVIYLPLLAPPAALERVGIHALGVLLALSALACLALLLGLPRAAFRDALAKAVRYYSKRLLIVYTLLLLIPLLLLNAVLFRGVGERLEREQAAAGEAALDSAQRVLGEYVLSLEPGFGIDTALNDELLVWLSRVVHHEVNLYWGSRVYASSKRELFTAGLLPNRIPGEIYSRLALLGFDQSRRINRAGGATYLEIYAPVKVPGVAPQERLFLSMPLLAQQEELAVTLASFRRKAVLVTAALFLLLMVVGMRLARGFTTPLMELVRGTQRIAAGASELALRPSELELAALVDAIDQMAARIAESRERLVREKQVVERMVENITAGVVSLDGERRVLLANRVAAQLLGVEVGQKLDGVLARDGRLAPLAAFLQERGGTAAAQATVRLTAPEGGESEWSLVWVPVPGGGEPEALLVVEDVTEVLRGQRLQAWAEMARIIAHEIKNPLTPIRLSAEHMREIRATDPAQFDQVFERCTDNILRQVGELQQIAGEFSAYSRIPRIEPREADLVAAVKEVVEGYRAAPPPGVEVAFAADPAELRARFDPKLLGRAVRNLLENALRASAGGGVVTVRLQGDGTSARVSVADRGPGVDPALLPRIFDPYFSTHASGTGLGLPIARRIAEEHGGTIQARNLPRGGLEVAITIPLS